MTETNKENKAVCKAFRPFGTTIFTEMTSLAIEHDAVNLSQGFPDFEGPEEVLKAAADAILRGPNQYVHSYGLPALRRAVADKMKRFYNLDIDPETQVTVTAGASEGLTATLLGLLDPGDEVILFEPCYDLYPPMIARAGARAVYVSLKGPDFPLPEEALRAAFGPRTRAILVNNPMNPCGKVFTSQELSLISELCKEHDVIAIGDEVYEHLTYDGREHVTLMNVPGLEERCIVISSTAKTFSTTGWKVGYTVASPALSEAVRLSHQFIIFCTPGALQEAMAMAIGMNDSYYEELHRAYTARRTKLCSALDEMGFHVLWPEGTYYVSIDIANLDFEDDRTFCHFLTKEVGVAAIPTSFFYKDRRGGRNLARFCFCKTDETLDEAIRRLGRWKR